MKNTTKLLVSSLAALVFATLRPASAPAQDERATPGAGKMRPPALLVKDGDKPSRPLRVASCKADLVLAGGLARVRLDLVFQNDLDRILEGELVLPLPQGATVSSLALEFDGKLREASVVEREKARAVFEEVVRRGVDPGLVEWVKGNVFRTRVYPIPAKGQKRVVLGYEVEGSEASVPLRYDAETTVSCSLTSVGPAKPSAIGPHVDFAQTGTTWRGELPAKTYADFGELDFKVDPPGARDEKPEVAIERARVRSPLGKEPELVFVARTPRSKIAFDPPGETKRPKRLTVLWDASGSASSRDVEKELAFLEHYLTALEDGPVRLVAFANEVFFEQTFERKEAHCKPLLERIRGLRPDGGTRLSCLDFAKWDGETDAYLVFTDGLSTFGKGEPALGTKSVTCVTSAASADFDVLDRIARRGHVVSLGASVDPMTVNVEETFLEPRLLLGATFEDGRVADVFPQAPARLESEIFSVAGRVRSGEKTKLVLHFGQGAKETSKVEIELDPSQLSETGNVERVWAEKKIAALSQRPVENEAEIVKTAKAFGVVTPFTSLLVLDTLQDYVRYRVVPPKEMEDEYWKIVESQKTAEAKSREDHLALVRAKWKARVEWWKKDFSYPADFKWVDKDGKKDEAGGADHNESRDEPNTFPPSPRPSDRLRESERLRRPAGGSALPAAEAAKSKDRIGGKGGDDGEPEGIALKPWDPKTPYIEAFKKCEGADALYAAYLDQRKSYASSTAFFLDSADYFYARKQPAAALRILSNLAELKLENAPLLRILGYRLREAGQVELAIATFEQVARIRPEEPQSWRDLALAQADAKDWAGAIANLEKVVLGSWDGRFPDIDLIALGELNDVIALAAKDGKRCHTIPDDLVQRLEGDLRVILTWDADACDMDLWVTEPSGEKAFYGHTATTIGGAFGKDFTQGYGPEEYHLKKAMKGTYKIQVNYYGNRQQVLAGDTTIQVTVIRNFGRADEERKSTIRRLKDNKETIDVAEVLFK